MPRLLRHAQHLTRKDQVGVGDLVMVCLRDARPPVRVAVPFLSDLRERLVRLHFVLREAVIRIDEGAAEDDRYHNLVDLRAVVRRELEHLNNPTRGRRQARRDLDVIVAPNARAAGSDGHCAKLRAIGIAHAGLERRLKARANAADGDWIVHEIMRAWLTDGNGRKGWHVKTPWCSGSTALRLEQFRLPSTGDVAGRSLTTGHKSIALIEDAEK